MEFNKKKSFYKKSNFTLTFLIRISELFLIPSSWRYAILALRFVGGILTVSLYLITTLWNKNCSQNLCSETTLWFRGLKTLLKVGSKTFQHSHIELQIFLMVISSHRPQINCYPNGFTNVNVLVTWHENCVKNVG